MTKNKFSQKIQTVYESLRIQEIIKIIKVKVNC